MLPQEKPPLPQPGAPCGCAAGARQEQPRFLFPFQGKEPLRFPTALKQPPFRRCFRLPARERALPVPQPGRKGCLQQALQRFRFLPRRMQWARRFSPAAFLRRAGSQATAARPQRAIPVRRRRAFRLRLARRPFRERPAHGMARFPATDCAASTGEPPVRPFPWAAGIREYHPLMEPLRRTAIPSGSARAAERRAQAAAAWPEAGPPAA